MATIISNPASFSSVRNAFNAEGYGSSSSFFAYRQGGGIVPSTSDFNVIGAGTAGDPLQLSQFSGFTVPSQATISISDDYIATDTVYESDFDFNTTVYGILANGLIEAVAAASSFQFDPITNGQTNGTNWVTPTSSAANYEVRATKVSGDTPNPGDALNTWLPCTSNRSWTLQLTGIGRLDCVLTIEIRDAATQTVRDTATITMMVKNQN